MGRKKSSYGDGTVFQTSSGEWRGRLTLTDPLTGQKLKPKEFSSSKSAEEVRRKMRAYRNDPLNYTGESVSKADAAKYFRKWADEYKKPRLKVGSYDRLDAVIRLYIEPDFEGIQLGSVTPDDCNAILNRHKDKGLSYSTVKKIYDALHACFEFAEERNDVRKSPMHTVRMLPKATFTTKHKDSEGARHLTEDEEAAFLTELDRRAASTGRYIYRYRDAFILDLNTGMRIGELVALNWDDVDFDRKRVHVYKTAVMVKDRKPDGSIKGGVHQIIQEAPKTSKSCRYIPLNESALDAMHRLKEQAGDSQFFFPTQSGARLVMSSLSKQYSIVSGHCAIGGTSFHSLRHTFATRLFERGADIKDVSSLLGHASVGITYNTYVHVIEERKNDVVGLLGNKKVEQT